VAISAVRGTDGRRKAAKILALSVMAAALVIATVAILL
jgi:hypothetical protein